MVGTDRRADTSLNNPARPRRGEQALVAPYQYHRLLWLRKTVEPVVQEFEVAHASGLRDSGNRDGRATVPVYTASAKGVVLG